MLHTCSLQWSNSSVFSLTISNFWHFRETLSTFPKFVKSDLPQTVNLPPHWPFASQLKLHPNVFEVNFSCPTMGLLAWSGPRATLRGVSKSALLFQMAQEAIAIIVKRSQNPLHLLCFVCFCRWHTIPNHLGSEFWISIQTTVNSQDYCKIPNNCNSAQDFKTYINTHNKFIIHDKGQC